MRRILPLLTWLLIPGAAFGQTLPSSRFPADHPIVYVVDFAGQETAGLLQRVDTSSITIRARDGEMSFKLDDIYGVHRRGDSVWSGAVIGTLSGVVIGLLMASDAPCGGLLTSRPCTFGETAAIVGFTSAVGAGIGVGIDALVRGRTLIYPFVSHRRAGVTFVTDW